MSKRLSRWLWFNFMFALTPLALMILVRYLGGKLTNQDVAGSSEVLFFSLMLSATSVGDAIENRKEIDKETLFTNMWCSLLFIAVISSILYGCLLLDTVLDLKLLDFRVRLMYVSLPLALVSLALSFVTQIWISRIEEAI